MDLAIGPLLSLGRGLVSTGLALIGSPLRIDVLEGEDRLEVLRAKQPRPMVLPYWVPDNADTPPATDMFDAQNLYLSIREVAQAQQWLPADQDRIVLHIYNKSDDAIFFKKAVATAHPVAVPQPRRGCVIQLGAGGSQAKVFGISVALYADRPCKVSANLEVNEQSLTSRMHQLAPRSSLYVIVDAYVGLGETAPMLDWRLWFELDTNRTARSTRRARVPMGRKYVVGPQRSFRIVNGAGATRYVTQSDTGGLTFSWRREPPA